MSASLVGEHYYSGGFVISEARHFRSRANGTITNNGSADLALDGGFVLAQVPGAVEAAPKVTGNTGTGTIGSLAAGAGAQVGAYAVQLTSATAFSVTDPRGRPAGSGAVGTPFAGEIGFTVTAGGTAFAAGDAFVVTVADGGWTPYTAATPPVGLGILFERTLVRAGTSRKAAVLARQAQVTAAMLVYDSSIAAAGGITAAAGAGNAGNGTIGAMVIPATVLPGGVQPTVPAGVFMVTMDDADNFAVADPTGLVLPRGVVGSPYSAGGIAFTITAGGTAFAGGDSFTIAVTESGQVQALQALAAAGIIAR